MPKLYQYRYFIEKGEWPPPENREVIIPGKLSVCRDSDFGYADDLLVVSLVGFEDDRSYLILSTEDGGGPPSRELLLEIRQHIDHYLAEHV